MLGGGVPKNFVQDIVVSDPPAPPPSEPPCIHDGNDGYCGTPDLKAPQATLVGLSDGASITTVNAPDQIVGSISPGLSRTMCSEFVAVM